MPWVRIDDHFDQHLKFAKAGPLGLALWVAGLAYCNRTLTDGFIPWAVAESLVKWNSVRIIASSKSGALVGTDLDARLVASWLVQAGLWSHVDGGYQVTDWTLGSLTRHSEHTMRRLWRSLRRRVSSAVFARDGYRCKKCARTDRLTVDHIVPIARGGTNDDSNLQTLCVSCNSRKRDRIEVI